MNSLTFFFLFIPTLALILLGVNLLFATHNPYQEKDSAFECGFHSFLGQNRTQFNVSFFIVGIIFLLFDLEILLVYPYIVSANFNMLYGLFMMLFFFLLLTLGFAFEFGKKALNLESRQSLNFNIKARLVTSLLSKPLDFVTATAVTATASATKLSFLLLIPLMLVPLYICYQAGMVTVPDYFWDVYNNTSLRGRNLTGLQNILDDYMGVYAEMRDMQSEIQYMVDSGHPYIQIMEVLAPYNDKLAHYIQITKSLDNHFKEFNYNILEFTGFDGLAELDSVSLKDNMTIIQRSGGFAQYVHSNIKNLVVDPYVLDSKEHMHIVNRLVELMEEIHNDKSYIVVDELSRCVSFISGKIRSLDRVLSAPGL